MLTNEITLTVRYAETDQMGIVHHSNYPIWYEASRTAFIRKLGLPYSQIEEMGVMLPLVELKCYYKGAAKYEDEVIIKTFVKEITGVRLTFNYEVYRKLDNGSLLINTGETMHAWTNKELKPVNLKKYKPEIFNIINTAANT
jgi:acyl-CoA thioester hydrolase